MQPGSAVKQANSLDVVMLSDLLTTFGYEQEGRLRVSFEKQGIPVFDSPKGYWTTPDLVKLAGLRKIGVIDQPNTGTSENPEWL